MFKKFWNHACRDVASLNERMLEVAHYRVLTCPKACSVQVYSDPIVLHPLRSLLSHLSSAIFCWQPWKKRNNCTTYIKHSTVKRRGLRKRRSSCLVPATGLHWFHIGLVSCVSLIPLQFLNCHEKKLNFMCKVDKRIFSCAVNRTYFSSPFCTLYLVNDKKSHIC